MALLRDSHPLRGDQIGDYLSLRCSSTSVSMALLRDSQPLCGSPRRTSPLGSLSLSPEGARVSILSSIQRLISYLCSIN
ncbi:hypothetical protein DY000_02004651 [Brassica cretica]|uniref:Uncharacterized protein n=1 Tax=Brassica cretica TaxID=69181 RepID=A0ABQ7C6M7_BRACR|nr:hypothetical protein DY000_02004651 [Brassica cretica]